MNVSAWIVNKMIVKNIIPCYEDKDIYIYGINTGFFLLLNIATSYILAIIIGKTLPLTIFLFSFIPLRSYCGGIHSKSKIRCYLLSNSILVLFLQLQDIFLKLFPIVAGIALLSVIYLICIPQQNTRVRKVDIEEKSYFDTAKCKIIIVLNIIMIVFIISKNINYAITIMSSIILSAILVFLGSFNKEQGTISI